MDIPDWVCNYIGIPYEQKGKTHFATDCLGLVELVYAEVFKIHLPDYTHIETSDLSAVATKMLDEEKSGRWVKLDKAEDNCLVLLNIAGYPVHVGIILNEHYMLHSLKGHNSAIERFDGIKWYKRIDGFYRYKLGKI